MGSAIRDEVYYNSFGRFPDLVQGMSRTSPGLLPVFTGESGKNREKCRTSLPSVCHEVGKITEQCAMAFL
jgi:hypothetical protein